jgi:hypothetical protein
MRGKKYKYVEDLLDDYIQLVDEQIEQSLSFEKIQKKISLQVTPGNTIIYKPSEAEHLFKLFNQLAKLQERKLELVEEITETEGQLKEFLTILGGGKISYEKKDDNDKSKQTFLFWLEDGIVKCNR